MCVCVCVWVGVSNAQQIEPLLETLYLNVRTECQINLTWPHSLDEFAKLSWRLSRNSIGNRVSIINLSLFRVPLNWRDSLNDSYSSRARQTEQERVSEWKRERERQGFISIDLLWLAVVCACVCACMCVYLSIFMLKLTSSWTNLYIKVWPCSALCDLWWFKDSQPSNNVNSSTKMVVCG